MPRQERERVNDYEERRSARRKLRCSSRTDRGPLDEYGHRGSYDECPSNDFWGHGEKYDFIRDVWPHIRGQCNDDLYVA